MSLIGDALRKTRKEAAERESDRKGVLFSARIAESPHPLESRARARPRRGHRRHRHGGGRQCGVVASQPERSDRWRSLGLRRRRPAEHRGRRSRRSLTGPPDRPGEAVPTAATTSPASTTESGPTRSRGGSARCAAHRRRRSASGETSENDSIPRWIHRHRGWRRGLCPRGHSRKGPPQPRLHRLPPRRSLRRDQRHRAAHRRGGRGFRVKAIERDRVHLSNGRRSIVLRRRRSSIMRRGPPRRNFTVKVARYRSAIACRRQTFRWTLSSQSSPGTPSNHR